MDVILLAQDLVEIVVQRLCRLRSRSTDERRAVAFMAIGIECELRDAEDSTGALYL